MEGLFKAKRKHDGAWVEGFYTKVSICGADPMHAIVPNSIESWDDGIHPYCFEEIDVATLCRSTGLKDVNGDNIFCGDILTRTDNRGKWFVSFEEACFYVRNVEIKERFEMLKYKRHYLRIIDNIHNHNTEKIIDIHDNETLPPLDKEVLAILDKQEGFVKATMSAGIDEQYTWDSQGKIATSNVQNGDIWKYIKD